MSRHLVTLFRLLDLAVQRGDRIAVITLTARIRGELVR